MKLIFGTNCFVDFMSAFKYYSQYGCNYGDVKDKIELDEIRIGRPYCPNDNVLLNQKEGRYFIETNR